MHGLIIAGFLTFGPLVQTAAGTGGTATYQQCGGPCQKCASEVGIPKNDQGKPIFDRQGSSFARVWQSCLEKHRAELRR
jgi:hypothetical protein